jgi:MFS family permease
MSTISFIMEGFLIYVLSYLLLMPDYVCVKNGIATHCSSEMTCTVKYNHLSNGKTNGYYIDYSNPTSLHNWIEDLDLRCASSWEIGFFGSAFFIGHVVGTTTLAKYGDIIGRIWMIKIGLLVSTIAYALVIFVSRSVAFNYLLIFIFGMFSNVRVNIAFLYG